VTDTSTVKIFSTRKNKRTTAAAKKLATLVGEQLLTRDYVVESRKYPL